jgi:transmembrane sensor
MSEINRHIIDEALAALPSYQLPIELWESIDNDLLGNKLAMPEYAMPKDIWSNIESELSGSTISLPDMPIPVDVWNNIEAQLEPIAGAEQQRFTSNAGGMNISWKKISMAAGLILACAVGWYLVGQKTKVLVYKGANANTCTLADGSIIKGQKNAVVQHPQKFANNNRAITQAEGQAFYEITKDAFKPFSITTSLGTITVLGTSFDVNLQQDSLCVDVSTGRVRVENDSQVVELVANQAVVMYKDLSRPIRLYNTNTTQEIKSLSSPVQVHYDNTPLKQVIQSLSQEYGVQILLHPSQEQKLISGSFASKNVIDLLGTIGTLHNLSLKKKKGYYILE